MLAAGRVPAGRAVGVDVWRRRDQSGNSRAAAERNATAEDVREQVELVDADALPLPFASTSFDAVVRHPGARPEPDETRREKEGDRLKIVLEPDVLNLPLLSQACT